MKAESFEVQYGSDKYNIYSFLNNHPGGVNYIAPYKERDVGKRMEDTKHSRAAYYLFEEYKKDGRRRRRQNGKSPEDLEKLVDWNKPMLVQVGSLGTKYKEWVISPVDRTLTLFGNPVLESLTITPWYVVPIVWIPIIIYLVKLGTKRYVDITNDSSPSISVLTYISSGILIWTFLEYSLHRWVFHMEPSGRSRLMIYIHFAIHGLHHKVPFDTRRLVFPPVPAAIIALTLYKFFSIFLPESCIILVVAGALIGYVTYDMIHFYLHYGAPSEDSYFYHLKRYHNQHHFAHHDSGFGISSILWDKIFGTAIRLRKLGMGIRW
ncbi:fatty acid 2-hydroxylase isoform X2 [Anthonomus grandis grandis]|uniref:fatty acid 2-hydroxylase isoform X2 n=1 Tax=Anthonomus grandis grandis TaxID=2921223 RepID=UPI002165D93D|nr:fatty acid 2-hydroxylase isoform X2 [Anthonomus grandis grandis]